MAIALVSVMARAATVAALPAMDKVAALVVTDPVVLAAPAAMDLAALVVTIAKATLVDPLAGRTKHPPSAQWSLAPFSLTTPNSNCSAVR